MKKFLLLLLIILSGTSSELLACEDVMFSIDFNAEAVIPEVISYNLYDNAGQHEGLITIAGESNFPFSICIEGECFVLEFASESGMDGVEDIFINDGQSEFSFFFYETEEGVGMEGCLEALPTCPDAIFATSECLTGVFELGSFVDGATVEWTFSDGAYEQGGHFITHEFPEEGEYTVCAYYISPFCEGETYCETIYVEDCSDNCTPEIEIWEQVDCGAYHVGITNLEDVNMFDWYLNGELYWDDGNYMVVYLEENGVHELCATYESADCGVVETCIELVAEGCEETCTDVQFGLLNLTDDLITSVNWTLSGPGITVAEGVAEYDGFGTEWIDLCIEEGCYYFEVTSEEGLFSNNTFSLSKQGISGPVTLEGVVNTPFVLGFEFCVGPTLVYPAPCPSELWYNASCEVVEFEIGSFQEGEVGIWDFGDGTIVEGGHYITHDYQQPGEYYVCVEFSSNECEGTTECMWIYVPPCNDCPTDIYVDVNPNCLATFILEGGSEDGQTFWVLDDELVNDGSPYFDQIIEEEGWHTICAEYIGPGCDGTYICTDFYVDACGQDECQAEIDIYLFDGCFAEISISGVDGDTPIYWSVGDEYFEYQANNGFGIDFPGEGVYEVCAEFWTEECGGIVLCEEVYVEGCDTDCFFVGAVDQLSCEEFVINMTSNFPEGEPLIYVDDVFIGSGWSLYFYLEPGEHVVCANLEGNEFCEQQWFCQDVYVEDCDCPTWIEAEVQDCLAIFYLDVVEGDVSYTVYGEGYQETFDGQGGIFTWPAPQNGFYEVCAFYFSDECEGTSVCTGFEITGCSDGECEITLDYDWIEGTTYVFEAESNQEGAPIGWLINGEYIETGNAFDYTFNEPGVYEVCAIIETEECPLGVQSCVNLVVPPSDDCTEVIITIDVEGDLLGDLDIAYELDGLDFPFGGDFTIYETCGSTIISFCIPDGCYEMTMSLEEFIEVAILMEMFIDGGIAFEYTIDPLTQTVTMEFGVNDDCSTSISEVDAALIEVYPVPSSDQITVNHNLGNATWNIFDAQGRQIESGTTNGQQLMTIDIQSLATGTYVIQLLNNQNTLLQRFQKVD